MIFSIVGKITGSPDVIKLFNQPLPIDSFKLYFDNPMFDPKTVKTFFPISLTYFSILYIL